MNLVDRAFSNIFTPGEQRSSPSVMSDFGNLFSGGFGMSSVPVGYKKSLTLSAVFNAVEQISNDLGKIGFGVFEERTTGKNRLKWHLSDILLSTEPNYLMSPFIFKKLIGTSLLLRGNSLFKIYSNAKGYPVSVEFINWDLVEDIRVKKGELLYYIKGLKEPLFSSEVLHFKQFSLNGIVGISTISYAAQQLGIAISTQEFSATNFESKGVSKGVIETDKVVNNKAGIIAGWRTSMSDKSPERITVLDDGFKYKSIAVSPQEMQIIEQGNFNVEEVARWFNIAPHKIKSLKQSTNNNIEQQSLDHVSDTIQPLITNIEQEFSKKLLTPDERSYRYIKGNMNVLLRSDIKSRGEYYARGIFSGWFNRNEVRALEDMNDGPELLNEFLTPVNTFTEGQIVENIKKNSNANAN